VYVTCRPAYSGESGSALLLALLALTLLSVLGIFIALNATTGIQISDNYESEMQATYASLAGIAHARILLRGLDFDELLKGPDGDYDASSSRISAAKGYEFRNPIPLSTALTLAVADPSSAVAGIPDDGRINTGFCDGVRGIELIPGTGIVQMAPDPYGAGAVAVSRYFVKVSDNNGEPSEIAGDAADNPFVDGDGIVIVRSLGIARTIPNAVGWILRRNSASTFEVRFKRSSTWDPGPALVVIGPQLNAEFSGLFQISGGEFPGIGTIDTISRDQIFPDLILRAAAGTAGEITGGGQSSPSIRDITDHANSGTDRRLLTDPAYLWDFVHSRVRQIADSYYEGNRSWLSGDLPDLGAYDPSKPWNAPGQDPKITVVHGDLQMSGDISGGGLLVVTGSFSYSGAFAFGGLVLVIGSGQLTAAGSGAGIEGGVLVANLTNTGGPIAFGAPAINISGNTRIVSNRKNIRMAISLIPASQTSFREIAGSDP